MAAGVVLAVVGTGQAAGTWQSVAAGTGGTAITAVPADPATAYDRLTSTLQARYVVRFAPPAGNDRVQLAVTSAGQRQTAELALPQAASNAAPSSTTPAARDASMVAPRMSQRCRKIPGPASAAREVPAASETSRCGSWRKN